MHVHDDDDDDDERLCDTGGHIGAVRHEADSSYRGLIRLVA